MVIAELCNTNYNVWLKSTFNEMLYKDVKHKDMYNQHHISQAILPTVAVFHYFLCRFHMILLYIVNVVYLNVKRLTD